MKHTPNEQKALETARQLAELTAEELRAIRETPRDRRTLAQRRKILAELLKHAAAEFEDRERTNDLYRHYLKKGDRSEARWYAPSPLNTSTEGLRRALVDAWRELRDFDDAPLAPDIGRDSKRWRKTQRFFAMLEAERAIERKGGKVRHRPRPNRREPIYIREPSRADTTETAPQLELGV